MLVVKGGIYHEIDEKRLDEFKEKGYEEVEPTVPEPEKNKEEGGGE